MQALHNAWAYVAAHPLYLLAAWQLLSAAVTALFGAAEKYATSHPRAAFVLGIVERAGLNARGVLALLAGSFKQPPGGGNGVESSYRANARKDEEDTQPSAHRSFPHERHLRAAVLAVLVGAGVPAALGLAIAASAPACTPQARQQVESDITNAAPEAIDCVEDIIKDLSGNVDIAGTIAHCGVTAKNIYDIAAYLLAQSNDAGSADGAASASPYDAHVRAWLTAAHDAMQAGVK